MITGRGEQMVAVLTLDTYCSETDIERIDVPKIDVQGHEPAMSHGAEQMLAEGRVDTITGEITKQLMPVIEPFGRHGFRAGCLPELRLRRLVPSGARGARADLTFERPHVSSS